MRRLTIFLVVSFAIVGPGQSVEPLAASGQSALQSIQGLSHNSPKVRAAAARALAEVGGEEAVRPLVERVADPDADARLNVAYALGRINKQPQQSIPALTQLLGDKDEHVRYSAQWSLAQIAGAFQQSGKANEKNAQRVGELLAAAAEVMAKSDAQESLQRRVQEAGRMLRGQAPSAAQTDDALADLIENLQAPDIYVQVQALAKLKHLDPAAAPRIMQTLATTSKESILEGKLPEALSAMGPPIVPALIKAIESSDEAMRDLAIGVLSQMQAAAQPALPQLNKVLEDKQSPEERLERVLMTISNLGPTAKESSAILARLIADETQSDFIKTQAMRALSAIGPAAGPALPTLMKVLRRGDESSDLRIQAAEVIANIGPNPQNSVKILLQEIKETENLDIAAALAAKLGTLGASAAATVSVLTAMVEHEDIDDFRRQELVQALGEIGPAAAVATPTLIRCLTNPDQSTAVHVAAAIAIGKMGPAAVGSLAEQLDNSDAEARLTIARALVALAEKSAPAATALIRVVANDDEDDEVRVLGAIALGKIGESASAAVPALSRILQDQTKDEQLRAMCAVAIGCIEPASGPVVGAFFNDPSKDVQVAAAYAVYKNRRDGREAAQQRLFELLADDEAQELAARALADIGKEAIRPLATSALEPKNEFDFRVRCIEVLAQIGDDALPALLAALNDNELAEDAQAGLQRLGVDVVPVLLAAAEDEVHYTTSARQAIQELVRYFHDGLGAGGEDLSWGPAHPLARLDEGLSGMAGPGFSSGTAGGRGPIIRLGPPLAVMGKQPDVVPAEGFKTVKVFYGTNRKPAVVGARPSFHFLSLQGVGLAALAICLACLLWQTPKNKLAILASAIGLVVLAGPQVLPLWRLERQTEDVSVPAYGSEFSDRVEMGVCDVTIPDIHEEGDLEGPSLLKLEIKVDPEKHIVLRSVQPLAHDAFFANLEGELAEKGRNVLVFIHGYNVSFEDAARRTAQMAADLKFPGAAAFYSWPSQAHWYKYRLDEKYVELSIEPLKSFLLEVAQKSNATTINLVAHSMGNRALAGALKEIDASARGNDILFNQVVLAAPDIDADIFKQQIAPAIVTKAHRITLYASSKDLALYASRQFNSGDSRAGDVGEDLVVVPGIETIDASAGDCSLLGHCYYGDSVSVLRDIERLLNDQPAQARPFLHPMPHRGMTYWLFEPTEIASEIGVIRNLR